MGLQETGENALVFPGMVRYEYGKPGGQDFQVQGECGSQVPVHVRHEGFIFPDGEVGLLEAHDSQEIRSHLHAGQKLRRRFQCQEPFKIMEQAELDDSLVPLFRRNEVVETSGGVREHGGDKGGRHFNHRAIVFFDAEMVGFLLRHHLHTLHVVGERTEEGLFLDGHLAYGFRNAAGSYYVDEVPVIHLAHVDVRLHCGFQHADGSLGGPGNMEGPGEVVYRAEGDKAEGGITFHGHHAVDHFVNGAVAAHADHVPSLLGGFPGKVRGIQGLLRQPDDDIVKPFRKHRVQ